MLNLRSEDLLHKSYLNRLLIEIIDRPVLAQSLAFKGGTCASMLGFLDRFSVDLDFDIRGNAGETIIREELRRIFEFLEFRVALEFNKAIFFRLRYPSETGKRNTLKVSASSINVRANQYSVQYLADIDRLMNCQTIETMFANKLVAVTDRYKTHKTIAGRDIYDLHYFFLRGFQYQAAVIKERTGKDPKDYFIQLIHFIESHITQTIINEDLNMLLPPKKFQQIRKVLFPETVSFLRNEVERNSRP